MRSQCIDQLVTPLESEYENHINYVRYQALEIENKIKFFEDKTTPCFINLEIDKMNILCNKILKLKIGFTNSNSENISLCNALLKQSTNKMEETMSNLKKLLTQRESEIDLIMKGLKDSSILNSHILALSDSLFSTLKLIKPNIEKNINNLNSEFLQGSPKVCLSSSRLNKFLNANDLSSIKNLKSLSVRSISEDLEKLSKYSPGNNYINKSFRCTDKLKHHFEINNNVKIDRDSSLDSKIREKRLSFNERRNSSKSRTDVILTNKLDKIPFEILEFIRNELMKITHSSSLFKLFPTSNFISNVRKFLEKVHRKKVINLPKLSNLELQSIHSISGIYNKGMTLRSEKINSNTNHGTTVSNYNQLLPLTKYEFNDLKINKNNLNIKNISKRNLSSQEKQFSLTSTEYNHKSKSKSKGKETNSKQDTKVASIFANCNGIPENCQNILSLNFLTEKIKQREIYKFFNAKIAFFDKKIQEMRCKLDSLKLKNIKKSLSFSTFQYGTNIINNRKNNIVKEGEYQEKLSFDVEGELNIIHGLKNKNNFTKLSYSDYYHVLHTWIQESCGDLNFYFIFIKSKPIKVLNSMLNQTYIIPIRNNQFLFKPNQIKDRNITNLKKQYQYEIKIIPVLTIKEKSVTNSYKLMNKNLNDLIDLFGRKEKNYKNEIQICRNEISICKSRLEEKENLLIQLKYQIEELSKHLIDQKLINDDIKSKLNLSSEEINKTIKENKSLKAQFEKERLINEQIEEKFKILDEKYKHYLEIELFMNTKIIRLENQGSLLNEENNQLLGELLKHKKINQEKQKMLLLDQDISNINIDFDANLSHSKLKIDELKNENNKNLTFEIGNENPNLLKEINIIKNENKAIILENSNYKLEIENLNQKIYTLMEEQGSNSLKKYIFELEEKIIELHKSLNSRDEEIQLLKNKNRLTEISKKADLLNKYVNNINITNNENIPVINEDKSQFPYSFSDLLEIDKRTENDIIINSKIKISKLNDTTNKLNEKIEKQENTINDLIKLTKEDDELHEKEKLKLKAKIEDLELILKTKNLNSNEFSNSYKKLLECKSEGLIKSLQK